MNEHLDYDQVVRWALIAGAIITVVLGVGVFLMNRRHREHGDTEGRRPPS